MNKGMKKHVMKAAACFLAGSMTVGAFGTGAMAAGESLVGIGAVSLDSVEETEEVQETEAGVDTIEETEAAAEEASVEETEAAENVINTIAVAQLGEDSYINIRTEPSTESDIVGKLYDSNAATILADEGEWYLIQSGNCQGYVAKYLLTTGEAAAQVVAEVGTPVAQVNTEALMVRADASEDAEVVDMVTADQIVYLEEDLGGWAKISTANGTGYVSADYVSYATYLPQAESVEEEAARIEAENAAWEAYVAEQEAAYAAYVAQQEAEYQAYLEQQQAEWEAQNQAWIEYLESQGQYADDAQAAADQAAADQAYYDQVAADAQAAADAAVQDVLDNAGIDASQVTTDGTSSLRQQVVDYALQFVGNPYVWGGTSLTSGADCSGFTQSVLADNGVSVSRTAGQQSQGGTSVDLDSIQPGDLLFYEGSGDYGIGHVSMYIGNGQVVHASNSTDGIIVSDVDYRTPVSAKSYLD